jgi:hypothetical protein
MARELSGRAHHKAAAFVLMSEDFRENQVSQSLPQVLALIMALRIAGRS